MKLLTYLTLTSLLLVIPNVAADEAEANYMCHDIPEEPIRGNDQVCASRSFDLFGGWICLHHEGSQNGPYGQDQYSSHYCVKGENLDLVCYYHEYSREDGYNNYVYQCESHKLSIL